MRTVIFDSETNGLLHQVTKCHMISLRTIDDGVRSPVWSYKRHEGELADAMEVLKSADLLVGHNILAFDLPMLEKLYPDFYLPETVTIRDTLVMARMVFANVKDGDFRLFEKGQIEGKNIGRHTLDAWGQRLGMSKGDYSKVREAQAAAAGITDEDEIREYVWGSWNPDMDEYGCNDVEVTTLLWQKICAMQWDDTSVRLEHRIHDTMFRQEQFGFNFNTEKATEIASQVADEFQRLRQGAVEHFGTWVSPKKLYRGEPRAALGEDSSRKHWAEVELPKKSINYKQRLVEIKIDTEGNLYPAEPLPLPIRSVDAPFCPVNIVEFNPNSRPQIIDRLTKVYQWEPVDFTEKGNPEVSDDVLRPLAKHIPICEDLAELFFLQKLLGQIQNGDNAWLKLVGEDGRIHGYVNVGGTISGRGSHTSPNIAQVPKVLVVPVRGQDGNYNSKVVDKTGVPYDFIFNADGTEKKKTILFGRAGKFGFECRSLFGPPEGWWEMGCDLSGVELRCLAARLAEFDGGAYVDEVLNGDPHTKNMIAFQIDSRDTSKTCLYAIMYGGGDEKIGSIVLPPSASAGEMKNRGKQLKANLQNGIPAFGKLIQKVGKEARRGHLIGLDGRKLWVRSPHAALNLQLQSDAAILAKTWVIFFEEMMEEAGYVYGVDWGMQAWVHDEIQAACRTKEIAEHAGRLCVQAAAEAGEHYNYAAPIGAEAKIGKGWAECH